MDITKIEYTVSKVEEKVIKDHFKSLLDHNDFGQDCWSQPEMDFHYDLFHRGWITGQAFVR